MKDGKNMKKIVSVLLSVVLMMSVMGFSVFAVDDVSTPVTGITIESPVKVKTGKSVQLMPVITPEGASNQNVTWEANSKLITVDSEGNVTANRFVPFSSTYSFLKIPSFGGMTKVKATTEDGGYVVECTVIVVPDIINIALLGLLIGIVAIPMFTTPVV